MKMRAPLFIIIILLIIIRLSFPDLNAFGGEGVISEEEQQSMELSRKEEVIRDEMKRLKTLKKEVEDDIAKYTKLLKQIEKSLVEAEAKGNKRLKHVAKAYEAMQPEDAASRLSGLDNQTAVLILLKMKSKKAGLVIGMMETKKASQITKEIAKIKK